MKSLGALSPPHGKGHHAHHQDDGQAQRMQIFQALPVLLLAPAPAMPGFRIGSLCFKVYSGFGAQPLKV